MCWEILFFYHTVTEPRLGASFYKDVDFTTVGNKCKNVGAPSTTTDCLNPCLDMPTSENHEPRVHENCKESIRTLRDMQGS